MSPTLDIPASGLSFESVSEQSSKSNSQDIIGLTLTDDLIEEMIQCVQNGKQISLSLGPRPVRFVVHFGDWVEMSLVLATCYCDASAYQQDRDIGNDTTPDSNTKMVDNQTNHVFSCRIFHLEIPHNNSLITEILSLTKSINPPLILPLQPNEQPWPQLVSHVWRSLDNSTRNSTPMPLLQRRVLRARRKL